MPIISKIFAAIVGLVTLCGAALANNVGVPPLPGGDAALIDQNWLLGLAGGQNQSKLFGITAHSGGGQLGAFQLLPGIALFQVDTVAAPADSVALPACKTPFQILVRNNGANALQMFAYPRSTDTINQIAGNIGISLAANTVTLFACIKDRQWSTVSGSGGGGGSVTSVQGGCAVTNTAPNPITGSGTINGALQVVNTVTTASYTLQQTDTCNLLLLQPGAIAVTVPAASAPGFTAGNFWYVDNQSTTSVTINITSPSNLDGSSSFSIVNGTAFSFQSDGSNYHFVSKSAPGIGTVTSLSGSCGIVTNPNPIINSGTAASSVSPTLIETSAQPILASYCGGLERLSGSVDLTTTIAQAGTAGFPLGWNTTICNIGNSSQSLTPGGGTIGSLSAFTLTPGTLSNPVCVAIISDGFSDYNVVSGSSAIGAVSTQSGTTYTFASSDCGTTVLFTNASAVTATIPQGLPVGCVFAVEQVGAGKVSVNGSAVTPATLHNAYSFTGTALQYSIIGIFIDSSNDAILTGDGS